MNAAYPNVVKKFLPKADIVFDQFHVILSSRTYSMHTGYSTPVAL